MKHKHSPNFFENLQEADTAKNNRATTFFWTVVTVALFLLGFSLTNCTTSKQKGKIVFTDTDYVSRFIFDDNSLFKSIGRSDKNYLTTKNSHSQTD